VFTSATTTWDRPNAALPQADASSSVTAKYSRNSLSTAVWAELINDPVKPLPQQDVSPIRIDQAQRGVERNVTSQDWPLGSLQLPGEQRQIQGSRRLL
jgi:hypothetical protein